MIDESPRSFRSRCRRFAFRIARATASVIPGGRISAFGAGDDKIGAILVVNLDRQPRRWRRMLRELGRFRTSDGAPLTSIARRLAAVDARDGRAVAATADVDPTYRIGDQLYVQPDARLEECFGVDEPIRMTRQEVAVARSHVEVWKAVATGSDDHVLVLEDDVWFRRGAAAAIDRGWRAALRRCRAEGGPRLLYLSYADAGGTAERADVCDALFRPMRGLWFLSGLRAVSRGCGDTSASDAGRRARRHVDQLSLRGTRRACALLACDPAEAGQRLRQFLFHACRTWRGRGSSMRARVRCRPIGRALARY